MAEHTNIKLIVETYPSLEEAHADGAFLWAGTWTHDTPPACVWRDTGTGATGLPGHLETTKENADRFAALWNAMHGIPDPAAFVEAARGMREALEDARATFLHYAYLHGAKGTGEGREKAQANSAKAREMQAALTAFDAAMGEGQSDE